MPDLHQKDCQLVHILQNPSILSDLKLRQWDLVLRQARRADLLARLAYLVDSQGITSSLPDNIRDIFTAAKVIAVKHRQTVEWEIFCIGEALKDLPVPIVYLKGAAYILQKLPIANGRLFSDVDIMVPKKLINKAEHNLMLNGWATIKQSAYEQRYYRKWMHELPPLRHRRRQTVIDVHHHILPGTARYTPDVDKLLDATVPVNGNGNIRVLAPIDMLLHSMTHLFCEGEFNHGLRDLVDIDGLIKASSMREGFWHELVQRAIELELVIPLFYALRYAKYFLLTPIPDNIWQGIHGKLPGRIRLMLMDVLFKHALLPVHKSCSSVFSNIARFFLYIRGHYLRMPLHLLLPHLAVKLFMGWKGGKDA